MGKTIDAFAEGVGAFSAIRARDCRPYPPEYA